MGRMPIELHIMQQQEWIREHGGDREGYLDRYGDPSRGDVDFHGNGGNAIYDADLAELNRLQMLRARGRRYL